MQQMPTTPEKWERFSFMTSLSFDTKYGWESILVQIFQRTGPVAVVSRASKLTGPLGATDSLTMRNCFYKPPEIWVSLLSV